jgi:hypothetical protein
VAAERGWNERSRLKIKSLAEDLALPDRLYKIAVERLQRGDLEFEERLTSWERGFQQFLKRQLSQSGSSVLTAAHEARAVRIARRQYEISPTRARQLLRQVAEQLGMSRVSKLEAAEYVAHVIDEQVGEATVIPDALRQRIHEAAVKWGVEPAHVDILIENRLAANRPSDLQGQTWIVRWLAIVLSLLLMLGLVWLVQKFVGSTVEGNGPSGNSSAFDANGAVNVPVFTPSPGWWSAETGRQFRILTADRRAARFPHEWLKSAVVDDRLLGYQEIVRLVVSNEPGLSSEATEMFARFFMDETIPVCRRMSGLIGKLAELPDGPLPSRTAGFARSWSATELLLACCRLPVTESRRSLLDELAQEWTGVSIHDADFETRFRGAVADSHWQFLRTRSHDQPEQAASLIDALGDLTRENTEPASPLEYSTAVNLLLIRPGVWNAMQRTLERIVASADKDQLRYLYLMKNRTDIPELQAWMGSRLARQLDIDTSRLTSQRVDEAIESSLGLTMSREGGLRARWQRLRDNRDVRRLLLNPVAATPQSIGEAVHYATIAMLLSQAESSGDPAVLTRADALYEAGPRNLSVRTDEQSQLNLPVYRRIQRRALPSDVRAVDDALAKLSDPGAWSDQARAAAIERLARAAPRVRDLPWDQALRLARYFLEADETSELVAIEKHLSRMRHWPHLALGLARQVLQTDGSMDQALTCSSLLLGFQPELRSGDWRPELHDQILQRVAAGLRHTAEVQGHDSRFQWNELRSMLMEHYRIRCKLAGVPGARSSAAVSPAELAELLTRASGSADPAVNRRIEANRYLANDELQRFTLQAWLTDESRDGRAEKAFVPPAADDVPGPKRELRPAMDASIDLAASLLQQEVRRLRELVEEDR